MKCVAPMERLSYVALPVRTENRVFVGQPDSGGLLALADFLALLGLLGKRVRGG